MKKLGKLNSNISKCKAAIVCLKDLIERFKTLAISAPNVISLVNPEEMLKKLAHVEKAHKQKLKNPVEIAWNVIELEDRYGKTWNECVQEANEKKKRRKELLAKYNYV